MKQEIKAGKVAKSIRLGWSSRSEQKPRKLSNIVGNGIRVERGTYSVCNVAVSKLLIP
jgi:hypothetical protein